MELKQLHEQVARYRQLSTKLIELRAQRADLSRRVSELDSKRKKEQLDVDRLEGGSLAQFFYRVVGKLDERLDQERREAYAAQVKYDAAVRELEAVSEDLSRCERDLAALDGIEESYRKALEEKAALLRAAGSADSAAFLQLEERITYLTGQQRELCEAYSAGSKAMATVERIISTLTSAENLGQWDILGGGLLVDMAKHRELDDAQALTEQLQIQLRRFKTELADVTIHADFHIEMDEFLRFADYFFDGLFSDWAALDHIRSAQGRVYQTRDQIKTVLRHLDRMRQSVEKELAETRAKRDALVVQTTL